MHSSRPKGAPPQSTAQRPPSLHFGVAAGQSSSRSHSTQTSWSLQMRVGAVQSAFERHAAQSPSALQSGVDPPQSALDVHCTHFPSARQRGFAAEQSAAVAQSTQDDVIASQMGWSPPAQSAFVLQPRQAPVAWSQMRASAGHDAPALHDGWHS